MVPFLQLAAEKKTPFFVQLKQILTGLYLFSGGFCGRFEHISTFKLSTAGFQYTTLQKFEISHQVWNDPNRIEFFAMAIINIVFV